MRYSPAPETADATAPVPAAPALDHPLGADRHTYAARIRELEERRAAEVAAERERARRARAEETVSALWREVAEGRITPVQAEERIHALPDEALRGHVRTGFSERLALEERLRRDARPDERPHSDDAFTAPGDADPRARVYEERYRDASADTLTSDPEALRALLRGLGAGADPEDLKHSPEWADLSPAARRLALRSLDQNHASLLAQAADAYETWRAPIALKDDVPNAPHDKETFLLWAADQLASSDAPTPRTPRELAHRWFTEIREPEETSWKREPGQPPLTFNPSPRSDTQTLVNRYRAHKPQIDRVLAKTGIPVDVFLTFAILESDLDIASSPDEKKKKSKEEEKNTAKGIMQVTNKTREHIENYPYFDKKFAESLTLGGGDDILYYGALYMRDLAKQLGIDLSRTDKIDAALRLYMAYFMGPSDVKKFLKLDDNASVEGKIRKSSIRGNPGFFSKNYLRNGPPTTKAETEQRLRKKVIGAYNKLQHLRGQLLQEEMEEKAQQLR